MRRRIGCYRVDKLLGHGASAAVYLARHQATDEQVAVKLFHLFMPEEQVKASFRREVEAIQRLKHPGIIHILDIGFDEENPYFTMPYTSGGSLRAKHPQGQQVPLTTVQVYLQQLASALAYAHQHKVIHLDIKPENILVASDGRLLLSDFGIARILHTSRSLTTQDPGGTLVYKAPEQFRGKPCPASDQYALAITVYEWLCGEPPFPHSTQEHLLDQHLFVVPPLLREKNPNILEDVEAVLLRALSKKPADRFPDVGAFALAFSKAVEGRYLEEVLQTGPATYLSCFLSCSHEDLAFGEKLYADLSRNGIPCWFAPYDLPPGQSWRQIITEAIHARDKFLFVFSHNAVDSTQMKSEFEAAQDKETSSGQEIILPLRIDHTVMAIGPIWSTRLQSDSMLDFANWRDDAAYPQTFRTLLQHLTVTRKLRNGPWDFGSHGQDRKKDLLEIGGPQMQELYEALISAYTTRRDLERMVFDGLGEHLSFLAREGNLEYMVFELLRWAQARGRVYDLIVAAFSRNRQNPQLLRVAKQLVLRKEWAMAQPSLFDDNL